MDSATLTEPTPNALMPRPTKPAALPDRLSHGWEHTGHERTLVFRLRGDIFPDPKFDHAAFKADLRKRVLAILGKDENVVRWISTRRQLAVLQTEARAN